MAKICKITDGKTDIDLLTEDWLIERGGVSMSPLTDAHIVGDDPVAGKTLVISYKLATSGATHDVLKTKASILFALLRKAAQYHRTNWQLEPVWIEEQARTETNPRRALVLRALELDRMSMMIKPADWVHYLVNVGLTLELEFPWGPDSPRSLPMLSNLTASNGPSYSPAKTNFNVDLMSKDRQNPVTKTGGLIGRPGVFGRAVQVGQATSNQVLNPSAEAAGNFGALGAAVVTRIASPNAAFGDNVYRVVTTVAANDGMTLTLNALANAIHYVTVYSRFAITNWEWSLDGAAWNAMVKIGEALDGLWHVYGLQFPAAQANGSVVLQIRHAVGSIETVYFDAAQVEQFVNPTPYCDGSLGPGHAWVGAVHGSRSTRAAHVLRYAISDCSMKGTLGFRMQAIYEEDEVPAATHVCSLSDGTANNRLNFYLDAATNTYKAYYSGNGAAVTAPATATDIVRLVYADVVITWDLTLATKELKLFIDGNQIGATITGLTAPAAAWDRLYVGGNQIGATQWSGWIDDMFLLNGVVWTPDEIASRHALGKKFAGHEATDIYLDFDGPKQVHLANFRDEVGITHFKERDGGAYIDLVPGDRLFPAVVRQWDAIIWGSTDQPLKNIVLPKLSVAGDLTTSTLQLVYNNGLHIALVLGTDYVCYPGPTLQDCLEQTEEDIVISINQPSDARKHVEDAVNAFWITLQDAHANPVYAVNPITGGGASYAQRSNYIEIPATSLPGDHPVKSLIRMRCPAGGGSTPGIGTPSRFIFGARSFNLGANEFVPMLNAGNQDNPAGWAVTYDADTSSVARPDAPGGYEAVTTFAADSTMLARCIFTGTNMLQYYRGKFEVFVGYWQNGGADEDINIKARFIIGSDAVTSPKRDTKLTVASLKGDRFTVASLGEMRLPFGELTSADELGENLIIKIMAELTVGAADINWGWIYLNPIDEWSGGLNDPLTDTTDGPSALRGATALDFDNGVLARRAQKYLVQADGDLISAENWEYTGFLPSIESNRQTRIYVLQLRYNTTWGVKPLIAETGAHVAAEVFAQSGHILMRGDD